MSRPDRTHYVIDVMPDFITLVYDETGALTNVEVVQIWVDPSYPDAHRDPALRAYIERRGEEGIAAIVRYSELRDHYLPAEHEQGRRMARGHARASQARAHRARAVRRDRQRAQGQGWVSRQEDLTCLKPLN